MAITYRVDITNAAGTLQGSGPIKSVSSWTVTKRMDRAGDWSFVMAGSDAQRSVVVVRNIAKIYAKMGSTWTYVGGGYIDQVGRRINEDGTIDVMVSGKDMLRSLTHTLASGEYDDTFTNVVNSILPSGWTATITTPPVSDLYTTLQYDTVLSALVRLSERAQTHFYLSGDDTVVFNHTWSDSGVRAVQGQGVTAAELAAIVALDIDEQSYDVVSRVYPLGSGNSGSALGLLATTQTAPAGYTLSAANNYIESDAAVAAYGALHRRVDFKDIRPLSGTDADVQAAADMLFDSALYWLTEHEEPSTSYRIMVAECGALLRPLQTIRLAYRDSVAGIALDDDLYILESTWAGNSDGVTTTELVVADSTRWPESDTSAIVDSITGGQVYQVHPQLNANSYVIPFTKPIDDDNPASFRFRFDDDVLQLNRVYFDFQLLPLESTVKSVGGASSGSGDLDTDASDTTDTSASTNDATGNSASYDTGTTGSGVTGTTGAGIASSGGGGDTISTGSGVTGLTGSGIASSGGGGDTILTGSGVTGTTGAGIAQSGGSGDTVTTGSGAVVGSGTLYTGQPEVAIGIGGPSTDSTGAPEGGDVVSAGRHQHTIGITEGGTVTYPVGFGAAGFAGGLVTTLTDASDFSYPTNERGNHTHDLAAHTHTLSNHTHALGDHSHSIGSHTHSIGNHTHSIGSHTHALGSHTHSIGAHTHLLGNHTHALGSHTHSIGNHTHSIGTHTHAIGTHTHAIGAHTHTVGGHTHTLNNHTHSLSEAITALYGIFRDNVANVYDITDIEYSVDGATWYAFTVGINGYTTLGDGWTRVDLTDLLVDSTLLRPTSDNWQMQIQKKAAGATGKAMIEAQLNIRGIIQAVALI